MQEAKSLSSASTGTRALLATSLAYLIDDKGISHKVRLLLDTASEVSLISEELLRRLDLQPSQSSIGITGVGGKSSGPTRGTVRVTLKSCHTNFTVECVAHSLDKITTDLPSIATNQRSWAQLIGLKLADPDFMVPAPIDLLVGADVFGQLVKSGVAKGKRAAPVALNTHFGWVVLGNIANSAANSPISHSAQSFHTASSQSSLEDTSLSTSGIKKRYLRTSNLRFLRTKKPAKRISCAHTPVIHRDATRCGYHSPEILTPWAALITGPSRVSRGRSEGLSTILATVNSTQSSWTSTRNLDTCGNFSRKTQCQETPTTSRITE